MTPLREDQEWWLGVPSSAVWAPTCPHLRSALPRTIPGLSQRDDLSTAALEGWDSPPSVGSIGKVLGQAERHSWKGVRAGPVVPHGLSPCLPGLCGRGSAHPTRLWTWWCHPLGTNTISPASCVTSSGGLQGWCLGCRWLSSSAGVVTS